MAPKPPAANSKTTQSPLSSNNRDANKLKQYMLETIAFVAKVFVGKTCIYVIVSTLKH